MKYQLNFELDNKNFIQDYLQHKGIKNIEYFLHYNEQCEENVFHLENITRGILDLKWAIDNNKKIGIIQDADADGILSSALFWFFFNNIEYKNFEIIFHNGKEHGIILDEIPKDIEYLIVPDAGTSDFKQHDELSKKNIHILIIDHHLQSEENKKDYYNVIIINNQLSPEYENKALCGTGVTFKFLKQYCKQYELSLDMNQYLDLVGIAIVGDVMDLSTLENRYYVDTGLHNIQNPFFRALVQKRSFSIGSNIPTPTDVAFYLIPAINAIIRVGTNEEQKILFQAIVDGEQIVSSTKRGHKLGDTEILKEQAIRLCDNAIARQKRERTKIAELLQSRIAEHGWENDKIIIGQYYTKDNINSNLTGLAAMELATFYQRPALVVHYNEQENTWSGSARNFGSAIPDLKLFFENSNLFNYCAGHAGAHGLDFNNNNLQAIREYCNSNLANINYTTDNMYYVDIISSYNDLNLINNIVQINKWKSLWGHGIEEPLICIINIPINKQDIVVMGNNGDSFKITKNGISYIRFKDLEFYDKLMCTEEPLFLTVVGRANINTWNGINAPQIFIEDYNIENIYDF